MGNTKEFDNILNDCLERLMKGEDINLCLARYPEHAAELEPLLRTAFEAMEAAAVKPRPEFRQRAAYEFQAAVRALPQKKAPGAFRWQLRWALPVALVVAILLGGTGTVYAATNALPDSPLYSVKLATEAVQLAFTPSDQGKAELYAKFADYRVEEIIKMAEKGDFENVEKATERMNSQLAAITDLKFNGKEKGSAFDAMMSNGGAQATTTTIPKATSAPTVTATKIPAPVTTVPPPQVVITVPPAPTTTVAGQEHTDKRPGGTSSLTDKEKLKERLTQEFEKNLKKLEDQLKKAPESLKPALQKAIDDARKGYEDAIKHLEED